MNAIPITPETEIKFPCRLKQHGVWHRVDHWFLNEHPSKYGCTHYQPEAPAPPTTPQESPVGREGGNELVARLRAQTCAELSCEERNSQRIAAANEIERLSARPTPSTTAGAEGGELAESLEDLENDLETYDREMLNHSVPRMLDHLKRLRAVLQSKRLPHPDEVEDKQMLFECAEWAWTIIANAGEGNWNRESKDWRTAAAKWRDESYYPLLRKRAPLQQTPSAPRSINNPDFIRDCSPGGGDLSGCSK